VFVSIRPISSISFTVAVVLAFILLQCIKM
jgi:hypothetical protein